MPNPYAKQATASSRARMRGRVNGKNSGGGGNAYAGGSSYKRYSPSQGEVGSYDSHEKTFAVGGVTGHKAKARGDRFANGGKVRGKKGNVNIVIHTGQKQPPAPMMPPMPPPGPPPGGPPGGGAPPPGGPPGGMPPGGGMMGGMPPGGGMNPAALQALAGIAGAGGAGGAPGGAPGMPPKPPGQPPFRRGGKVQKKQGGGPAGVNPGIINRPSMAPALPAQSTAGAMPGLGANVAGGPASTATMPPNLLGQKRGGAIKRIPKQGGGPAAFPGQGSFPGQGAPVAGGWPGLQGSAGEGGPGAGGGGGGGWAAQPNVGSWTPGQGKPPWAQGNQPSTPAAPVSPAAAIAPIAPPSPPIEPPGQPGPAPESSSNAVRIFKRGGRASGGRLAYAEEDPMRQANRGGRAKRARGGRRR